MHLFSSACSGEDGVVSVLQSSDSDSRVSAARERQQAYLERYTTTKMKIYMNICMEFVMKNIFYFVAGALL